MAIFKPYKITSSQLETLPIAEGQFIVTTDTNKIYLDESASSRIELIPVPTKTSDLVNDMNFMSGMTILSYGHSTWSDFITAYTAKHVVYTRASSQSNPASGSQTRLAFMAYVNNADNPTEVEFQYYRSVSSHSATQQGDQTYVYKLNKTNGWSVTVRENYTRVVAGTNMSGTWRNGVLTLDNTLTVPTKTSDLTNDSGFIDNTVNNLTNYTKTSDLATVATSGDYDDLTNKPTLPTVNDATLTIQKNGTTVNTFSANADTNVTANIEVPTKTSDLTNDSGYTTNTGTITGVSINGTSVATSGVANITSIPASTLTGAIPSAVTATTQTQGDNSTKIATTAYVDTAIDNMPDPMVFKGSLGTGGTVTALPVDGSANIGDTYKVITAGTYASKAAKVGDTFICLTKTSSANTWELIPSGDEPGGTVTSIAINATSPIVVDSSSAITTSGTRTLSHANSGVTAGTYKSVTVDAKGHVTAGSNPTTLDGYGITDAIDCDDNLPVASANYVGRVYCYTGSGNGIASDYICGHIYQCLDLTAEGDYSWVDLTEKGYEYILDLRSLINLGTVTLNNRQSIQDTSLLNTLVAFRNKTGTSEDETINPPKLGLLVYTSPNSSQTDYHDHMFLNLQSIAYGSNGGDGWSEGSYDYVFEGFSNYNLTNYVVSLRVDTDYTYGTYEVNIKDIQFEYMPTPSSQYQYMTIQYVGSNSSDYLFGHFYRCQLVNNTYTWVPVNIEDTYTVFDAGSNTFNFFTAKPGTYICSNTVNQVKFRYYLTVNASSYTTFNAVPVRIILLRSAAETTRLSGTYLSSNWTTNQLMGIFEYYEDEYRNYLYTYGIFINKNQQICLSPLQNYPNRVEIVTNKTIDYMFEPLSLWIPGDSPIPSLNYDYVMNDSVDHNVTALIKYWIRGYWNTRAVEISLGYDNIFSYDETIKFYPIQESYYGDDEEIYKLVSPTLNLGKATGNIMIIPTFNSSEEITGGTIKFRFIPNNTSDISHMDNVLVNKKYVDEHGSQRYDYELYSGITFNDLSKLGYWYTLSSDTALVSQLNQMIETGLFDDSYIKKITAVLTTCDSGCGYYREMYTLQSIYTDTSNIPEYYYFVFSNFSNLQLTFRCSRDTTNTWAYQVTGSIERCYTMPTPTFIDENRIVMYTGTTNSNYTNGYIYKCIRESYNTYVWQRIDVQPASTDTKNTAGTTNTTNKIYLAGATSQAANPQTYSNVNCYASGGKLYSNAKEVVTLSDSQALTNKTYNGYTLAAASAKAVDTSISASSTSTNLPTSQAVANFVEGKGYITSYTETDPVFTASAAYGITSTNITNWNGKQNQVLSGTTDPDSSLGENGDIYIKYSA